METTAVRTITPRELKTFAAWLTGEEKSPATREKYLRAARAFAVFAARRPVTKEVVLAWKESLVAQGYAARTVNALLAGLNSLLACLGWQGCRVKSLKTQRQTYCLAEKELTKAEYLRLLDAARGQPQLRLVMETLCGCGIRVSELRFFTVEAVQRGRIEIRNKGKSRTILMPKKLKKKLLGWAKQNKIKKGPVFVTKNGNPLDRSSIWARMKRLCRTAGVAAGKVFPHNLRKLFARMFYKIEKDIAKLADLLGHSSINTTRIYIMTTGAEHLRQLERLGLVV